MSDNYDINLTALSRSSSNQIGLIHALVRGKNWLGGTPKTPAITNKAGLLFLTKPDLKLTTPNINSYRRFSPLLSSNRNSLGALIRDCLDPRTVLDTGQANSRLNDPLNPFLSVLDNTALSLDGWPDYVTESIPTQVGSGAYGMYSGSINDKAQFSLTSNHKNLPGDIINHIITVWQLYGTFVRKWLFSPHRINVVNDRIDYASRWYRFVFNETGTHVDQFTMCGYCHPIAASQGAVMNFSTETNINEGYAEVPVQWDCYGTFHNDPIVIDEFNRTVMRFNPMMDDTNREDMMVKLGGVSHGSLTKAAPFSGYGYPRIDPRTMEFQVWVPTNQYSIILNDTALAEAREAVRLKSESDFDRAIKRLTNEQYEAIYGN